MPQAPPDSLADGLVWKPIEMSAREAEFLAYRALPLREFARIFGVRPLVAGNLPAASSFAAARIGLT